MSGLSQIVRLREARLTSAGLALAIARDDTQAAERGQARAETEARQARETLDATRDAQCRNLADAGSMLALLDRRRFDHAVAHSARNDAAVAVENCLRVEAERRALMIRAQARRDALVDHARLLAIQDARRSEERAAIEAEDGRIRS